MAAELGNGSVPPLYREVYEIVCPNQEQVNQDLFIKLMLKSSLSKTVISQIWEIVEDQQGYLTRSGLYYALALTALAQQGKSIGPQTLKDISKTAELPCPTLGSLTDLKTQSVRVKREHNPNILGYSYGDLLSLDNVRVQLVPERKGMILKHVEYEVTSQKYKTTVHRRYTDFVVMHEFILSRFPYRIIPKLPPKKMNTSREFIEQRRKSLQRYLNIIARHPSMCDDSILKFFLTYHGSETQNKMKDNFRGSLDEFMLSPLASNAKDIVPMDTSTQITNSKEHMRFLYSCVVRMRDAAERIVNRATEYATDMQDFGKQLSAMQNDPSPVSTWATGSSKTWRYLRRGLKALSQDYSTVADKAVNEAVAVDEGVVEKLACLQELLSAYQDLCERHEKGVIQDHQKALQKMGQFKKRQASVQTEEELQHRILEQESTITNMENRNFFSLHCLQLETQLLHSYLDILADMLRCMAETQSQSHHQLSQAWEMMRPSTESLIPTAAESSSPLHSPGSPSIPARQLSRRSSRD